MHFKHLRMKMIHRVGNEKMHFDLNGALNYFRLLMFWRGLRTLLQRNVMQVKTRVDRLIELKNEVIT